MIEKRCEICSRAFHVKPYRQATARFCSGSCRATWVGSLPHNRRPKPWMIGNKLAEGHKPNRTSFKPGLTPWNSGRKGLHLSPTTEFKPGRTVGPETKPIGALSIRRRKKDPGPRAYVKIALPNRWRLRAILVWEAANGPVPPGKLVHHQNRDTLDDNIDNLRCLTRAEHLLEHQAEIHEGRWSWPHSLA